MNTSAIQTAIFPKGEKTSADYFTGTAWLNILVPKDESGNYSISNVDFEPGSRTNWHTHPAGQILLVTAGEGYYQERGKPARLLRKGDVVNIPSHIEHWHGAKQDSQFTHIAITNITAKGAVEWLTPVTYKEYESCQAANSVLKNESDRHVNKDLWLFTTDFTTCPAECGRFKTSPKELLWSTDCTVKQCNL